MSISGALLVGLAVLPSRSNWKTDKGGESEELFGVPWHAKLSPRAAPLDQGDPGTSPKFQKREAEMQ
jgi:hypothetical protein